MQYQHSKPVKPAKVNTDSHDTSSHDGARTMLNACSTVPKPVTTSRIVENNACDTTTTQTKHVGVGQTCAKVILFGEHSVVYGYPAIAIPLANLTMQASVVAQPKPTDRNYCNTQSATISADTCNDEAEIEVLAAMLGSQDSQSRATIVQRFADKHVTLQGLGYCGTLAELPARFSSMRTAIEVALEFVQWQGEPLTITTTAEFPPERGLGSSAAAAGAIIRAILDYHHVEATNEQLFSLTQCAEKVAHGQPSGLDAVATSATSPIRYYQGTFSKLNIHLPVWIVLADSGEASLTKATVQAVQRSLHNNPVQTKHILEALGDMTLGAETDILFSRIRKLGERMTRTHRLLSKLGVSTMQLDTMVQAALDAGAWGAKLTGGGGGGCVIALASNQHVAQAISKVLRTLPKPAVQTWLIPLDMKDNTHDSK